MRLTRKTLSVVIGSIFFLTACNNGSGGVQQAQLNQVNQAADIKTSPQNKVLSSRADLNDGSVFTSYGNYVAQGLMDTIFGVASSFIPGSGIFINPIQQILFDWLFGTDPDQYSTRFDKIDSKLDDISEKLDLARAQMSDIDELVKKIYIEKNQETFNTILAKAQTEADSIINWDRNKYFKLNLYDKIRFINRGNNSDAVQKELNAQYSLLFQEAQKNCSNNEVLEHILNFSKPITKTPSSGSKNDNLQFPQDSTKLDPANEYDIFISRYASQPGSSMTDYWKNLKQSRENYLSSLFDRSAANPIMHDNDYMLDVNILNQDMYDTTFKLFSTFQRLYDMQMIQLAHYYACNKNPVFGKKTEYSLNFSNLDVTKMPKPFTGKDGFIDSMKILNATYDNSFMQLVKNIKNYLAPVQSNYVAKKLNEMYGQPIFGKSFTELDSESVGYCSLIRANDAKVIDTTDIYARLEINAACVKNKTLDVDNVGKYRYESSGLSTSIPYIQTNKYGKASDILISNVNYSPELKLATVDITKLDDNSKNRRFKEFINEKDSESFEAADTSLIIRSKNICPFGGCLEYRTGLAVFNLTVADSNLLHFGKLFGVDRTIDPPNGYPREKYLPEDIDPIIQPFKNIITTEMDSLAQRNAYNSDFVTIWDSSIVHGSVYENGYFSVTYNGKVLLGQLIYEYNPVLASSLGTQLKLGDVGGIALKQRIKLSCIDPVCIKEGNGKFSWKEKDGSQTSIELLLISKGGDSIRQMYTPYVFKLKGTTN